MIILLANNDRNMVSSIFQCFNIYFLNIKRKYSFICCSIFTYLSAKKFLSKGHFAHLKYSTVCSDMYLKIKTQFDSLLCDVK